MRFNFFSALTFLSYLFEGFLIAAALDLVFNRGNLILHLGGDAESGTAALAAEFLAVILFFILGHANSTFAHLLLQQFITSFRRLRPSYYFLTLAYGNDEADEELQKSSLSILLFKTWSLLWKPFSSSDANRIREWMDQHQLTAEKDDRDIFAQGFWKLFNSSSREKFDEVIANFNFSRNMLSAFVLIGIIFTCCGDIQETAELLNLVDCEDPRGNAYSTVAVQDIQKIQCKAYEAYNTTLVAIVFFAVVVILVLRFLYFFGVITKNVIRTLVDPPPDSKTDHTST